LDRGSNVYRTYHPLLFYRLYPLISIFLVIGYRSLPDIVQFAGVLLGIIGTLETFTSKIEITQNQVSQSSIFRSESIEFNDVGDVVNREKIEMTPLAEPWQFLMLNGDVKKIIPRSYQINEMKKLSEQILKVVDETPRMTTPD